MSREQQTAAGLRELLEISHAFGADPEFVLAGGGNTSFKNEEELYVKASGVSLAEITPEGFVRMSRRHLAAMWGRDYPEDPAEREAAVLADLMAARETGEESKRPSVETSLHDFLPQRFVVHTHATVVNGLTCARRGQEEAVRLFGERVLWIPTVNPGYILAATVRRAVERYRQAQGKSPDILFLQNHGLIVAGEDAADIRAKTSWVIDTIRAHLEEIPRAVAVEVDRARAAALAPALRMLLRGEAESSILTFRANALIAALARDRKSSREVSTSFSPDHIVYCNHEPLFVPRRAELEQQYTALAQGVEEYRRRNAQLPKIVVVEALGAFGWGPARKNADAALDVFQDALKVLLFSRSFGGPAPLPAEQVDFIRGWEVEHYRQKVSAAGRPGRVAGKVALVTGAAQGFGLGLAEALLCEGAHVVLADVNFELAGRQATRLAGRFGPGRAWAQGADVSREASVEEMVTSTVLAYGGLDLFISNAGVLRAGGLEDLSLETFELVTRVNYTAYFLGCRYASRPMKIQHRFDPAHWMDIVEINSKSGLGGSNRNFAYAGSKFGGIGLTQSFALELVEHNIKVNAVCPGNFLDGPLWSDPEKGLFVQYLRAGKVPGAKTIADVRRYYEEKVPMGRGCTVQDVARAVFYLVEQLYETGQALPVTGGQVMLK